MTDRENLTPRRLPADSTEGKTMTERPIIFTGESLAAIMSGAKTQTRRVINPQPPSPEDVHNLAGCGYSFMSNGVDKPGEFRSVGPLWALRQLTAAEPPVLRSPYGYKGDRLWVRETFRYDDFDPTEVIYRADMPQQALDEAGDLVSWKPSIFMPRRLSRLTLEITEVRVEQLTEISEEDARAEGIRRFTKDGALFKYWPCDPCDGAIKCKWAELPHTARDAYQILWDKINGRKHPWESSPWVWAISFKVVK